MIPCGERKSKFFVSVGGAVVKPKIAGVFQAGNFRRKKKVKDENGDISIEWINEDLITFVKDRPIGRAHV